MRADCHCDTALYLPEEKSLLQLDHAQQDLQRIHKYLDLDFMAIFVDEGEHPADAPAFFARVQSLLNRDLAAHEDLVRPLLYREQLEHWRPGDPTMALISMEGAEPMGRDGEYLEQYYADGLRALGLSWNYANRYAGGCGSEQGITGEGRELIAICEEKGILLDAAHLNRKSFWQLTELATKPFIVSHTCCDALCSCRRNLDDEQMKAVAELGGVMGICFVADFLGGAGDMARLCEHIEYSVSLLGSDHVAIGSDLDGCQPVPELAGVENLPRVYEELRRRGMSENDLKNIAGDSVAALLRQSLPSRSPGAVKC